MSNTVTLGQVEQLAAQLPLPERLKLVARICEQLSFAFPAAVAVEEDEHHAQQVREAMADALLQELDTIAESIEGEFDSAEDIRQIREERASHL